MMALLKRFAAKLPVTVQQELKRKYFANQIGNDRFFTDEKEFALLDTFVAEGDWVLDIGANIGHYTKRFSDLVGDSGRVLAFEPVPHTFELLAANVQRFRRRNVTLLNVAASDTCGVLGMEIPAFDSGITNFYQARLTATEAATLKVLTLPVGTLPLPHRVRLVKMDTEGHELAVLKGMANIIERDHPVIIAEASSPAIGDYLQTFGYTKTRIANSSNEIFTSPGDRSLAAA